MLNTPAQPAVRLHRLLLPLFAVASMYTFCSLRSVLPAHVAVVTTFGHVQPGTLSAGLHVTSPWAKVVEFSLKTSLFEMTNHVPTKEGLTVDLDVAVLYRVQPESVPDIFLSLGPQYEDVVIKPELSSAVRGLTSEADAKALYTNGRSEMQRKLKTELAAVLAPRGILLEDVLLKAVTLPSQLTHSIELKAQAEQDSARMEFVLAKERQEAERKAIEARGIAEFQRIVSEGITPSLLQWKGIEATEKMAESPNSKVVVMGNTKESLPVMLSADTAVSTTAKAPGRNAQS